MNRSHKRFWLGIQLLSSTGGARTSLLRLPTRSSARRSNARARCSSSDNMRAERAVRNALSAAAVDASRRHVWLIGEVAIDRDKGGEPPRSHPAEQLPVAQA